MLKIVALTPLRVPLLNRFYKQQRSPHRAGRHEQAWVVYAESTPATIIAAAKLKQFGKELLLVGVLVAPAYRKQGVASALLSALVQQAQAAQRYYAFIEPSLWPLYRRCGFTLGEPATLPASLAVKFVALQKNKGSLMALYVDGTG